MQTYSVRLESPVSTSFRCQKAADSLDIDSASKAVHKLDIEADLETPFNVGLIVGASGSGKTTLAKQIFGDAAFESPLADDLPILEQFPKSMSYDDCVALLTGVGLTQVPCWIRPVYTLSNGQRARAEIALMMAAEGDIAIDEWTSVVDRTVAKVMSHSVQKFARRQERQVVLCSCHYDVVDWLNPDWIIDCNRQEFVDRRSLRRSFEREETIQFDIREVERRSWRYFSKYHYLSDKLPGGIIRTFGLFHGAEQVGFQCFANYTPHRDKSVPMMMHSNRTVIHPDYVGFGMGIRLINLTSAVMLGEGYDVWARFSSAPVARAMSKVPELWELQSVKRQIKQHIPGENMDRKTGFRQKVKVYSFHWIGASDPAEL